MPSMTRPLANRGETTGDLKLELGRYIRSLREKRGMTQADLAKAVGMTYYTAVSAIEVGRNTVPPERYLDFARALGVNPRTFMRRVLQMTNPWANAMLFAEDPEEAMKAIGQRLADRWNTDA
jgi:transcriptional regulator with XRE-family HTH domain